MARGKTKKKNKAKKGDRAPRCGSLYRGLTVSLVKSSPYAARRPLSSEYNTGDQFDARVVGVVGRQTPEGHWGWSAFPRTTAMCQGWNPKRCAGLVTSVLREDDLPQTEEVLSTICVLLKLLHGYPRQRHLVSEAEQRAIVFLSKTLGATTTDVSELLGKAAKRLRDDPYRVCYEGRYYVREHGAWIDATSGLLAPRAVAVRLEADFRAG